MSHPSYSSTTPWSACNLQPRAVQSNPEQPGAAQSSPEQPGTAQSSPEQPGAAQSSSEPPRAAQSCKETELKWTELNCKVCAMFGVACENRIYFSAKTCWVWTTELNCRVCNFCWCCIWKPFILSWRNVEWVRIVQGIDVHGSLSVIMLRILSIPSPLPRTSLSLEEWSYRYIYIYIYIYTGLKQ